MAERGARIWHCAESSIATVRDRDACFAGTREREAANWGLAMRAANDVAIRHTDGIAITIAAGEPWV